MSYSFDSRQGLIVVRTELFGTSGSMVVRLALDTGATRTTVNVGLLTSMCGQTLNLNFRTGVVVLS